MKLYKLFLITLLLVCIPSFAALTESDRAEFLYHNLLKDLNPGAENGFSKWTASGGTFDRAKSGTNFMGIGNANFTWDASSAGQTLTSASITIPKGYAGTNGLWRCKVMNLSGATTTMGTWDGTTLANIITIPSGTTAQYVEIMAPFGAAGTTTAIRFTSVASDEPLISIDDCYVGPNFELSSVNSITDRQSYTPTFTGLGTVTPHLVYWRVGNMLHISGNFVTGTTSSTTASMTLPAGLSIDTTNIPSGISAAGKIIRDIAGNATTTSTEFNAIPLIDSSNPTFIYFGTANNSHVPATELGGSSAFATSETEFITNFEVPISGWTANSAVRADNSDVGWTAYTPTFTGLGTVSNASYFYRRVGDTLEVRGTHTNGTTAASLFSMTLPSGLSLDTTKISLGNTTSNPGMVVGRYADNGGAGAETSLVTATGTSTSLIYSGNLLSNSSKLTPQNGSTCCNNSAVASISFKVPIAGWSTNQRAPQLVGSVTSNTKGMEHIERAVLTCSSSSSISSQSGSWISSISNISSGVCTLTINSGEFSAVPTCTLNSTNTTPTGTVAVWSSNTGTSTSIPIGCTVGSTGAACSSGGTATMICMGPR